MKTFLQMTAMVTLIGLVACTGKEESVYAPPDVFEKVAIDFQGELVEENNQVDILFVIDNSNSMFVHQDRLSKGIDTFVEALSNQGELDVQIGVVGVHDSDRYIGSNVDLERRRKKYPEFFEKYGDLSPDKLFDNATFEFGSVDNTRYEVDIRFQLDSQWNYSNTCADNTYPVPPVFPPGQLRPPLDPSSLVQEGKVYYGGLCHIGQGEPKPFISNQDPDYLNVLARTLKIGAPEADEGAPVFEEVFTPIVRAISPELLEGPNRGFLRPDAHLAVIIITEARDGSDLQASDVRLALERLKKNQVSKISMFGMLWPDADTIEKFGESPEDAKWAQKCYDENGSLALPDPGLDGKDNTGDESQDNIWELIKSLNGEVRNLCSTDYREILEEFGGAIAQAVGGFRVVLPDLPEQGTIKVTLEGNEVPKDPVNGWSFNPSRNEVILNGSAKQAVLGGAQGRVEYTAVKMVNVKNGRAKPIQ